ncbi:MAG: AAA family ATPase [Gemmatimonadetes bacterium]|nr:AAA family ATPase [Gemmatimonadota bacterium]
MSPPVLQCRLLGPVRVTLGEAEAPAELLWRKHLALLVYLARSPRHARTREHLIGLLWGDRDEKQARHSLSEALRVLRRTLGEDRVTSDVDQVRLAQDAVQLDCDLFIERKAAGDWAGAAALVEGEFLEGLSIPDASGFEDWLTAERASWRAQTIEVLVKLSDLELARGDIGAAAGVGQRAFVFDPTSELAARAALCALALAGDRAGALQLADELRRALAERLGTKPEAETERLVERIRDARVGRRLPAVPPAARRRPPLVGRGAELAALSRAGEQARHGRAPVVIVEGEPGEGKTRLLDELVGRARLEEASVAAARAVPADQARPWSAVTGLLAAGLAEAPGLAGASPAALAALGALDSDLAARFRATAPPGPVPDALSAAVQAVAGERPLLLVLDDAQWLDAGTVAALPALARDAAGRPVMLALGVTLGLPDVGRFDELRARLGRDLEGTVIRPGRFDDAALGSLVTWALPRYAPEEIHRLVRRLERDTAGIPLLAIAMAEAVADGFKLVPDSPAWPSPKRTLVDSLPGDLPPAVVGAVCLRFRGLAAPLPQVLGAAAAIRDRVDAGTLARAAELDVPAVERALDQLEWERWLAADARGYVFSAPIVRDVLLQQMLTPGQAKRYRERAGL